MPRVPKPQSALKEVCAPCNVVFRDFRAWSVHAFKCHGRIDEVRSLTDGLQCPHCLRHFATNVRLCRHIRHSTACRRTLLGNRQRTAPLPGIGSRKAPKEHLFCAPTLQAAGPHQREDVEWIEDELDRPAAEVLDCLAHIDYDGLGLNFDPDVAWARVRQAFSCVCLPVKRLQVTAQVWLERLSSGESGTTAGPILSAFLLRAAQWVTCADFAEWLALQPTERPNNVSTFRHSESNLSLLDFSGLCIPAIQPWTIDHVLVCVGPWPPKTLDIRGTPEPLRYEHEASLLALAEGQELDFFVETLRDVGFFINVCGLPVPAVDTYDQAPHFEAALPALRLSCDCTLALGSGHFVFEQD